jgi:hypothetical protein
MYAISIMRAVNRTALTGTPDRHCLNLLVMNSGPVCPRNARVCKILEAMYMEFIAQVNDEKTKTALKK